MTGSRWVVNGVLVAAILVGILAGRLVFGLLGG